MKGFKDSNKKFHPMKHIKGVRSRRDTSQKLEGVKIIRKQRLEDSPVGKHVNKPKIINDLRDIKRLLDRAESDIHVDMSDFQKDIVLAKDGLKFIFQDLLDAVNKVEEEKFPETQNELQNFITRKFNKELASAKVSPFRSVNFREVEKIGKDKYRFRITLTSHDDETVKEIEGLGFKATNINDVLDTRHATFEGDLGLG